VQHKNAVSRYFFVPLASQASQLPTEIKNSLTLATLAIFKSRIKQHYKSEL
jgi:hypothetical protein